MRHRLAIESRTEFSYHPKLQSLLFESVPLHRAPALPKYAIQNSLTACQSRMPLPPPFAPTAYTVTPVRFATGARRSRIFSMESALFECGTSRYSVSATIRMSEKITRMLRPLRYSVRNSSPARYRAPMARDGGSGVSSVNQSGAHRRELSVRRARSAVVVNLAWNSRPPPIWEQCRGK